MQKRTRWLLLGGGALALLVTVGVGGWAVWRYGQAAWWARVAALPLDETERAAVDACEDPGWNGLLKVLEQDVDVSCPTPWFAEQMALNVLPRHPARAGWLRRTAADASRTGRVRFRAGSGLLLAGRDAPAALVMHARAAGVPERDLVDVSGTAPWREGMADPHLRTLADVAEPDLESAEFARRTAHVLERAVVLPTDAGLVDESRQAALDLMDLDVADLREIHERRASGKALGHYPSEQVRLVLGQLAPCVSDAAPDAACLEALGAELRDGLDAPAEEPLPEALAGAQSLWMAREAGSEVRASRLARELVRSAAWTMERERPRDRAERLVALVSGEPVRPEALSTGGMAAEQILVTHTGLPWSRAWLAAQLGALSEVEVAVGYRDERVWLRAGDRTLRFDPCGQAEAIEPEAEWPEAWPLDAVLARVALEEASLARLRGDEPTFTRLAQLASRLDPASGAGSLVGTADGSTSLKALFADPGSRPVPVGAEEARKALGDATTAELACVRR